MNERNKTTIGEEFKIKTVERHGGSTWVGGLVDGHIFWAKIYGGHAKNQNWEIGRSRISKLDLRRIEDDRLVFNWDRGLERPRKDPLGQEKTTMACRPVSWRDLRALRRFLRASGAGLAFTPP
jgi:hypothetical protein